MLETIVSVLFGAGLGAVIMVLLGLQPLPLPLLLGSLIGRLLFVFWR